MNKKKFLENTVPLDKVQKKLLTPKEIKEMQERLPKLKAEWEREVRAEAAAVIRKTRKEVGITQAELASMLHTSRTAVVAIESGKRNITLKTLIKTAKVMGKELEISFS